MLFTYAIIVSIAIFVVPPILVFGFKVLPKPIHENLEVVKEEYGEIPEDGIEYFLVDPDPND